MTHPANSAPGTGILVFDSIHYVLAAEQVFLHRGLWCDMIPTPRSISSNCGMVIEFRWADSAAVGRLIGELETGPRSIYQRTRDGYVETDLRS